VVEWPIKITSPSENIKHGSASARKNSRLAQPPHRAELAPLCHALWPESSAAGHGKELEIILAGILYGILSAAVFVVESNADVLLGILEAGPRSHVDRALRFARQKTSAGLQVRK
jgi:hypothetical protein